MHTATLNVTAAGKSEYLDSLQFDTITEQTIPYALDPQGPLSHSVPSVVSSEVNGGKEGRDEDEEARLLPLIYCRTIQGPVH